jgi:UDP-N-acetylmuramoyl-tripeptide--D-alanyl-D-alanine ligase
MIEMPSLQEAGLDNGRLEVVYKRLVQNGLKICTDSRKLQAGDCFVALRGERFDGHGFVGKALEGGAAVVLAEEVPASVETALRDRVLLVRDSLAALQCLARHHRRSVPGLQVIGVAGSNGKTTCKELIYAVLSKHYVCHATPGNYNNHLGVALSLLGIREGTRWAVIEIGTNHPGEVEMLCHLAEPDLGVVTSIGKEHLEGLGSLEAILHEETALYRWLNERGGQAFANRDNDMIMRGIKDLRPPITYGVHSESDCVGKLDRTFPYLQFRWDFNAKALIDAPLLESKIYGDYNFPHVLAAAAIGRYLSVPYDKISEALTTWEPRNNRSQWLAHRGHGVVLDAYNANPDSMQAALGHFGRMEHPHKAVLLGEMLELGQHSEYEHRFLLENLLRYPWEVCCLVGASFWSLRAEFPTFHFFERPEDLHGYLETSRWPASAVLVKGSRGNAMEQYLDSLPWAAEGPDQAGESSVLSGG